MHTIRSISFILVAISLFSGCTAAVVGGAAAGGYYVGTDERTLGEITDDAAITAKVNAHYLRDKLVKTFAINVDTYRKTVYLYGQVQSGKAAERAVELAQAVKGVRKVVSKLTVLPTG